MTTLQATLAVPFLDLDLSWLEFNQRVLHEALDERTPLLERLKFLAIFSSNCEPTADRSARKAISPTLHRSPAWPWQPTTAAYLGVG